MNHDADPKSHWADLRDQSPSVHLVLNGLAAEILKTGRDVVQPVDLLHDLTAAKALHLIQETPQGVSFVELVLRDQYVVRSAFAEGAGDWHNPQAFATRFGDFLHSTSGFADRRTVTGMLVELLVGDSIDILDHTAALARTGTEGRQYFWSIYHVLCECLPTLDRTSEELIVAVLPILDATAGDMTHGFIHSAIAKWAAKSEARASDLLDSLRTNNVSRLMPVALTEVARLDRAKAHAIAMELVTTGDQDMRSNAIVALGGFSYELTGDDLLTDTLRVFADLCAVSASPLEPALVQAYFSLMGNGVKVDSSLKQLSTSIDSRTRYALAQGLFLCADKESISEWWRATLMNLASTPKADLGTFRDLDYASRQLAKTDPEVALRFIELVSSTDNSIDRSADVHALLPGTMAELLSNSGTKIHEAITDWFGSDQPNLHRLAASVVQALANGGSHRTPPVLSTQRLLLRTDTEIVDLLQRVAGWVIGGVPLATLMTSSLRTPTPSASVASFVADALEFIVLYNYPGSAGQYLRSRLVECAAESIEARAIEIALAKSDSYYAALAALPELVELRLPSRRQYLIRLERARMHERIIEEARSKSVLMSIVHRVPLKYGNSSFSDRDGVLSDPSVLGSFSHEVELPRGEMIDPIGQLLMRINLKRAAALEAGDSTVTA